MRRSAPGVAAAVACVATGCGGHASTSTPAGAVRGYLSAIAADRGQQACDILTIRARAEIVATSDTADCPRLIDELDQFLGSDRNALKNAIVGIDSETGTTATATATLNGHSVTMRLVEQGHSWRLDTTEVVNTLMGIPRGS
jgi:hypothetical protein